MSISNRIKTPEQAGGRRSLRALRLIAAALATGAAGVAQAWNVTPSTVSVVNGQGVTVSARLFKPAGNGPFPAVVMMHGCSGIFSYSDPAKGIASLYREWGDRLVGQGYVALLVDSFSSRNAAQNQCGNGAGGTSEVADRPYDAVAGADYLKAQAFVDAQRIGLLGWSHGASSALATLEEGTTPGSRPFRVGVAFYPGCGLYNAYGGISGSTWKPNATTVILAGGNDPLYTSGNCDTRVSRAQSLGASAGSGNAVMLQVYAGAQHSYDQARSGDAKWTGDDLVAKSSADALTLQVLSTYLN